MFWKAEDQFIRELIFCEAHKNNYESILNSYLKSLDWKYIITKTCQEGVSGIVFHHLQKYNLAEKLPPDVHSYLLSCYNMNFKQNLLILCQAKRLLRQLNQAGITVVVLKGLALMEHNYPSLGMRGMSDIDILVRKDDLLKADQCLALIGYTPRDSTAVKAMSNPSGYLASLDYRKDSVSFVSLHIHWHIVNTSIPATMFAGHVDMERIWEKSVPAEIADTEVRILSPEHTIIYLCEHALRVGHSFNRLVLVYDIFQFLKTRATATKPCVTEHPANSISSRYASPSRNGDIRQERAIDWDLVMKESKRFNLCRFVYCGLSIVSGYSGSPILSEITIKMKPPTQSPGEKLFLRLQLGNHRIRGSSYLLYLAMNKGLAEKCQFLYRTFFPPSHILAQKLYANLSEGKKPGYPFRVYEIFIHFFKLFLVIFLKNLYKK